MLRNTGNEPVVIRWDGKQVTIAPGKMISVVTEFGAAKGNVLALEDRCVSKYKGKIAKGAFVEQKQSEKEIKESLKKRALNVGLNWNAKEEKIIEAEEKAEKEKLNYSK